MSRIRLLALGATLTCALVIAGCAAEGAGPPPNEEPATVTPEPETDDVPLVVAAVNGQSIDRASFVTQYCLRFQRLLAQATRTGQPVDQEAWKQETLQSMVDDELLVQDARARGHRVTSAQIEVFLAGQARAQNLADIGELLATYATRGLTEAQVRDNAERHLLIDALIHHDLDIPEPTEAEIAELYEAMGYADVQDGVEVPSLAEIGPELRYQARARHREHALRTHLSTLHSGAHVETFLPGLPGTPAEQREHPSAPNPEASGPAQQPENATAAEFEDEPRDPTSDRTEAGEPNDSATSTAPSEPAEEPSEDPDPDPVPDPEPDPAPSPSPSLSPSPSPSTTDDGEAEAP